MGMKHIRTKNILTFTYDSIREYQEHRAEMESKGYMLIRYNLDDYQADYRIIETK